MGKRIINDAKLLEMFESGNFNQKELARLFNVSGAAICKKLKRLQAELPPSLEALTVKEQKFCLEVASGETQTNAALKSFDCGSRNSAKAMGAKLMQKPALQVAISELLEECGMDRRYRLQKLRNHIENRDPNVSLKALDQSWKVEGMYGDEGKNINVGVQIDINEVRDTLTKLLEHPLYDPDWVDGDEEKA
ncbi:MAG: hypothetical protein HZA01_03420 [Nitrospinae bacterium]|nr:hypothetical protein [Nitrospinota bacterium]